MRQAVGIYQRKVVGTYRNSRYSKVVMAIIALAAVLAVAAWALSSGMARSASAQENPFVPIDNPVGGGSGGSGSGSGGNGNVGGAPVGDTQQVTGGVILPRAHTSKVFDNEATPPGRAFAINDIREWAPVLVGAEWRKQDVALFHMMRNVPEDVAIDASGRPVDPGPQAERDLATDFDAFQVNCVVSADLAKGSTECMIERIRK